jgi:hypothetical protein
MAIGLKNIDTEVTSSIYLILSLSAFISLFVDVGDIVVYIFSLSPLKCRDIIPLAKASTPLKSAKTSSLIGKITL